MASCGDGAHDRVYAAWVLTSNPPQYQWICRDCGTTGVERGPAQAHDNQREYDRLVRFFDPGPQCAAATSKHAGPDVRKAQCNRCGAEIEWWKSEDGITLPVDPERREHGYLILTRDKDGRRIVKRAKNGTHGSHFDTCPGDRG